MALALLETTETSTQLAHELATIAQQLKNCTVQVRSSSIGGGSGVIWHSDGLIITNAHVAQSEKTTVELEDGQVFEAVRTSVDPRLDLAALQINATDLPAATVGDSQALRVKGSLAQAAGLLAGDVLIGGCGHSFNTADDFLNVLTSTEPGEVLPLEFLRAGKPHSCEVKIPASNSFSGMKSP